MLIYHAPSNFLQTHLYGWDPITSNRDSSVAMWEYTEQHWSVPMGGHVGSSSSSFTNTVQRNPCAHQCFWRAHTRPWTGGHRTSMSRFPVSYTCSLEQQD